MKKLVGYTGGLIALYIIVAKGGNFAKAAGGAANASSTVIKTLQGRG